MITSINNIGGVRLVEPLSIDPHNSPSGAFQQILNSAVDQVNAAGQDANTKVGQLLSGEGPELHDVLLSAQKAELSFEMFQSVRNKVVQAYQEIMRMQL